MSKSSPAQHIPSSEATEPARHPSTGWSSLVWYWLAPTLLTLGIVWLLIPKWEHTQSGSIGEQLADRKLLVALLVWIVLCVCFRYWSRYLPFDSALPHGFRRGSPQGASSERTDRDMEREGPKTRQRPLYLVIAGMAIAMALVTFGSMSVERVEASTMVPTLERGSVVGVHRLAYGLLGARELPQRGDLITIRDVSRFGHDRDVILRVVALPGERVGMRGSSPVINGWTAPACDVGKYSYVEHNTLYESRIAVEWLGDRAYLIAHPASGAPPLKADTYLVQPGEVFTLGDNRGGAVDSRHFQQGLGGGIALSSITGKVSGIVLGTSDRRTPDWSAWFQKLGPIVRQPGFDIDDLQAKLSACLEHPPENTTPPKANAPAACGDGKQQAGEECDDGNQLNGDGCDEHCVSEKTLCERCTEANTECSKRKNACTSPACQSVLECANQTQCAQSRSMECYCGEVTDPVDCLKQPSPSGSCARAIETAAATTDPETIGRRFIDPEHDLGSAFRLIECQRTYCAAECGLVP